MNPVLVVPGLEKGRGGGHLIRSLALIRDLRALGRETWLYLEPGAGAAPPDFSRFCEGFSDSWTFSGPGGPGAVSWAFIVLDRFRTPEGEFRRWAALGPLIGIDEGGPCRKNFDFLIDLLPGLNRGPNIQRPSLIPLPEKRRPLREGGRAGDCGEEPVKAPRILVGFGAEDAAGLGLLVCRALTAAGPGGRAGKPVDRYEIDYIPGTLHRPGGSSGQRPAGAGPAVSPGIRFLPPVPSLGEHLADYDLLITHYGLSAFEALYARVPVLLVSPGPYHEKLAKRAGFFSAGIGAGGARRAASFLYRPLPGAGGRTSLNQVFPPAFSPEKIAARHGLDRPREQTLAGLLENFAPLISPACPGCGSPIRPGLSPVVPAGAEAETEAGTKAPRAGALSPVLARFPRRTYRRCPRCGIIFMERLDPPPIEYSREYFFEFYQKQYGKTYLEDFPSLIALGHKRLKIIRALLPEDHRPGPHAGPGDLPRRLLDIGCAYGPFLVAAQEAGFVPLGIDPAEDAVRYIRETLKLEALAGFFPETALPAPETARRFDTVCLWYVIEHFRDPRQVLAEARRFLMPGGVLAFATPAFSGISGRKNRRDFLEKSPPDHWTIWSPQSCRRILKKAGFRLRRLRVTGHHPERFPLLGRFVRRLPPERRGALSGALLLVSRIFRLGDTFEAYATAMPEHTGKTRHGAEP
ncbi:MAG: class I SAM-dependent methyltransferase [Treponema sp.]|nr:class I SAM-dependent methyltransferase [Treponema sp.]